MSASLIDMEKKRKRVDSGNVSEHDFTREEVEVWNVYEKKFSYTTLQNADEILVKAKTQRGWLLDVTMKFKEELNKLKSELNDKEIIEWHEHTQFTNIAGQVVGDVKKFIHPELCTGAWCKFYEIVSSFGIIDLSLSSLNTLHLCEAPGAFVTSLNHFLVSNNYGGSWDWMGVTLNPYYEGNNLTEMVNDDRFIKDTLENWYFCEDNTGNLLDTANVNGVIRCVRSKFGMKTVTHSKKTGPGRDAGIMLITADGSIDCQDNPAEQEGIVSHLHYCETLLTLQLLSKQGSFVLKLFTMYECETIILMLILNCCFDEVTVFKPGSSKPGNSEVYVVCKGYRGYTDRVAELVNMYFTASQCSRALLSKDQIPSDFLDEHMACCSYFKNLQSETIKSNLRRFMTMSDADKAEIDKQREQASYQFFDRYALVPIRKCDTVVKHRWMKKTHCILRHKEIQLERADNIHSGSFKKRFDKKEWAEKVNEMPTYNYEFDADVTTHAYLCVDENACSLDHVSLPWHIICGSPITMIHSSKFCNQRLLSHLYELTTKSQFIAKSDQIVRNKLNGLHLLVSILNLSSECLDTDSDSKCVLCYRIDKTLITELAKCCHCFKIEDVLNIENFSDVSVVLMDLTLDLPATGMEELSSSQNLLQCVLAALKGLNSNGTIILITHASLTRFTIGLIYIVSLMFQKIHMTVYPDPVSLSQVVVFQNFKGPNTKLLDYLDTLLDECASGKSVLEFVQNNVLLNNNSFKKYLTYANESLVKYFINNVIECEKRYLAAST